MKRHTAEQVIAKRRQAEADLAQGANLAQVLEAENARRKRLVAELALDKRRPTGS